MAPIRTERSEPQVKPYSIPVSDPAQDLKTSPSSTSATPPSTELVAATTVPDLLKNVREGLEQLLERGGIDARASRQGKVQPKVGACMACRTAKTKCSGTEPCTRCSSSKTDCVYERHIRRGRKREPTPNALLLVSLLRDTEKVYAAVTGTPIEGKDLDVLRGVKPSSVSPAIANPAIRASSSSVVSLPPVDELEDDFSEDEGEGDDDPSQVGRAPQSALPSQDLEGVFENPLAILAHVASKPKKKGDTTVQESGASSAFSPVGYDAMAGPAEYFSTGLYEIRLDIAPELDIVNLGFVTAAQFAQIVDFYFNNLHDCALHLNRSIHTPRLLRETSPFLSTVLAFLVSSYIAEFSHLVPALQKHAMLLSDRVFSLGYKSLEIVQAYCLLANWTPLANNWGSDRQWAFIGQALRIATEIRMDKDTNDVTCARYASITEVPEKAVELFGEDRRRTWALLFMSEVFLCVLTGRFNSITGLNFIGGFRPDPTSLDPNDPNYNFLALEALHRIYAKALMLAAGLREESASSEDSSDLREAFNVSWAHNLDLWKEKWTSANAQTQITFLYAKTILLSISLQFPGPVVPVLEKARSSALAILKLVATQLDSSVLYGANSMVTTIVYAATLLLRLDSLLPPCADANHETVVSLCTSTAQTLEKMAAMRPTIRTFAGLHGIRLRKLLSELDTNPAAPASVYPPTAPVSATPARLEETPLQGFVTPPNELYDSLFAGDSENTFLTSWMLPPTDWTAGDPSLGVGIEWPTSLWASAATELEQGV
ncbi:hypothetical protein BCR35DRAFT_300448 [Leucosporidium creatinivorum]|uniref:Zn(2)-C6 fungal-type domain-containing protein n=1 Tax=Leucosporidium creatinivorum TaxID=106004 RepID=A0A1Y2G0S2_9BASI|nr:hypothetical protein BCR35DRAFT_300448 [Leucosporidium creatinivorum]